MKQNVTITGSTGLLGQYLCRYFSRHYNVTGLYFNTAPVSKDIHTVRLDLRDATATKSYLKSARPDFLVHCAGLTSVDTCEENSTLAAMLNVNVTENLVHASDPQITRMLHVSTDHLFAGKTSFHSESAETSPLNEYARTKLAAEHKVAEFDNAVIVRTNFYGGKTVHKKSFSNWVYDELNSGNRIHLFNDVFFTPISVCSLAFNIEQLMLSKLAGIYNVVGSERISKFTFAHMLANFFQLNSELIVQSKVKDASLKAPRPQDMSLSIDKIKNDLPSFRIESVSMGFDKIKSEHLI